MSTDMITLGNKTGDKVQLPEAVAKKLFGRLSEADQVLGVVNADTEDAEDVEDVEDGEVPAATAVVASDTMGGLDGLSGATADEPLAMDSLDCPARVLEVVRDYALRPEGERTTNIPQPLDRAIEDVVRKDEMTLLEEAAKDKYLTPLLEIALELRFDTLSRLCAAFAYQRIDKIAKAAPNIMQGAEDIRQFLNIKNEWTKEEMDHLRKEMVLAKELDPNAY